MNAETRNALRVCALCFALPLLAWLMFWRGQSQSAPVTVTLLGDSHIAFLEGRPGWENRAVSGQTVEQLLPTLRTLLRDAGPVVILSIGANDLSGQRPVWLVEQETQLAADMIAVSGRRVVVAQIPVPRRADLLPGAVSEANYQRFIWATARGYTFCHVPLALKETGGALAPSATIDGQHLTPTANTRWQEALSVCVENALREKE